MRSISSCSDGAAGTEAARRAEQPGRGLVVSGETYGTGQSLQRHRDAPWPTQRVCGLERPQVQPPGFRGLAAPLGEEAELGEHQRQVKGRRLALLLRPRGAQQLAQVPFGQIEVALPAVIPVSRRP